MTIRLCKTCYLSLRRLTSAHLDLDLCLGSAWFSVGLVDLLGVMDIILTLRQYGTSRCLAMIHSDSDGPSTKFTISCIQSASGVSPSMLITCSAARRPKKSSSLLSNLMNVQLVSSHTAVTV